MIFIDCGECVDRLVALLDQVRSHLTSLRSLVYELIALDEADKEGLSNISTTMNSIMVRHYCNLYIIILHIHNVG